MIKAVHFFPTIRFIVFLLLFVGCQTDKPMDTTSKASKQNTPVPTKKQTLSVVPPVNRKKPLPLSNNQGIDQTKKNWAAWINNHPYSNRSADFIKNIKNIPKTDRPDLAMEQEFLKTVDPVLKRVPRERLEIADKYMQELIAEKATVEVNAAIAGVSWKERGPTNIAGRTRAIAWDLNDGTYKKVWAGGVNGGLWYTDDITASVPTWVHVDGFWDNIAISTIAIDPGNPNNIYVGTGEGWGNFDAANGGGIWKSADGGVSWSRLAATIPFGASDPNGGFKFVNKIVVKADGTVFAATRGEYIDVGGILKSTDNGTSWNRVLSFYQPSTTKYDRAADLEIAANGDIYASFGIQYQGGVFKSTHANNGASGTWTDLSTNIVIGGAKRIELACAPSDANIIYAVAHGGSGDNDVEWFKKSTDGGSTWSAVTIPLQTTNSVTTHYTRSQAWYDLILAVHPTNPDIVLAGGIDLHRTTNGTAATATWTRVSYWARTEAPYVHADQHAIAFRPGNSNEIINGNDGGIFYSTDAGNSGVAAPDFLSKNTGYNVTQYYSVSGKNEVNSHYYMGGTQDNGSLLLRMPGLGDALEQTGGDGAFSHVDQDNPNYQITAYVYNNIYFSTNDGRNFTKVVSNNTGEFINPTTWDNTQDILYASTNADFLKRVSGIGGTIVNTDLPLTNAGSSKISALKVSPYTANVLLLGTSGGRVLKVTDANATPADTRIDLGTTSISSAGNISSIDIGASDNQILVTISNYGVTSVWETTDGGTNWASKEGNLPDIPIRWALYNPNNRNQVMVATELGIWTTDNFNAATPVWGPSNTSLAHTRCDMLYYRAADKMIAVATHGRGIFTTDYFATTSVADFSASNYLSCNGSLTTTFYDGSIKPNSSWAWDIDNNGSTDYTTQNPSHTFNTGLYTVKLTVDNGSSTVTKSNNILILNSAPLATANPGSNSNYFNGGEVGIHRVTMNTLDNASKGDDGVYKDYSCSYGTILSPNTTYTVIVNTSPLNAEGAAVYIDYNADGDYADANEFVTNFASSVNTGGHTASFTTPSTGIALNQGVRMRVLSKFSFVPTNSTDVGDFGQAEDYTVYFQSTALPVQFTEFAANCSNTGVVARWTTAVEINSSHFDVQRNTEGDVWETIGTARAKGNSQSLQHYQFTDNRPVQGKAFYRLKQVDMDGKFMFSDITSATCNTLPPVILYPNPVNQELQVSNLPKGLTLSIYNIQGMLLKKTTSTQHTIRIPVAELPSGTYLLQWFENGKTESRKFIIQR